MWVMGEMGGKVTKVPFKKCHQKVPPRNCQKVPLETANSPAEKYKVVLKARLLRYEITVTVKATDKMEVQHDFIIK